MFHYNQSIQNTRGDALIGYFVQAISTADGSVVPIYADSSSTPIISVSGVADMALVNSDGMADFWIAGGEYHVDIYASDASTKIGRLLKVPMPDAIGATADALAAADAANAAATSSLALRTDLAASTGALLVGTTNGTLQSVLDAIGSGGGAPTAIAPAFIYTAADTGLIDATPGNVRTGFASTTYAVGGYLDELTIAVTGTAGSKVLTSTEPAKVAGLGSTPFDAVLNGADGNDFYVTVASNNGSTQITLIRPLAADFTGTLSSRGDSALGQHQTRHGMMAYAQLAAKALGVTTARGALLDGDFVHTPVTLSRDWAKNAALTAYGVSNSAAPIVQSTILIGSASNIVIDNYPRRPVSLVSAVKIGTLLAGHGAIATLYAGRKDCVVEFFTGAERPTATPAMAQITTTVTVDGTVVYSKTHDDKLTRVLLPLTAANKIEVALTNADGGIYYIVASQLTVREAGIGGKLFHPGQKVVTCGDSWFAYYDGQFATSLAAKSGATVVNHSLGGMTTEWILSWLDTYVIAEAPQVAIFHSSINESNKIGLADTGTYTAPDGSLQPLWPASLTEAQSQARYVSNIKTIAQRCIAAGIQPVFMLPPATSSAAQISTLSKLCVYVDVPAPADSYIGTAAEFTDTTSLINNYGKKAGRGLSNGSSLLTAAGPLPADAWANSADNALAAVQKASLTVTNYQAVDAYTIGTDGDADGLSDGLAYVSYGAIADDTYTSTVVSGKQRYASTFVSPSNGNKRLKFAFTAEAGKEYLVVAELTSATVSQTLDAVSDITGSAVTVPTLGGLATTDASGNGKVYARAAANAAGTKYFAFNMPRANGTTKTMDVGFALAIDLARLFADAPNAKGMSNADLADFVLALKRI